MAVYDEDKHSRPANEDGVWYAIVRIQAEPEATISEVRAGMQGLRIVDDSSGNHPVEAADILVDERFGLYPDMGCDGPVVYFP